MASRRFVGEGGGTWVIDVPLSENYSYQYGKGTLRLADGEAPFDQDGSPAAEPKADPSLGSLDKPARSDPKVDWIAYAAQVSDLTRAQLDELSKADLTKRFG